MANMDANTNKVYRKKYFMDADKVVFSEEGKKVVIEDENNPVIDATDVQEDREGVLIRHGKQPLHNVMQVEALRQGDRITMLKIDCPCGRHTEINVQYAGMGDYDGRT